MIKLIIFDLDGVLIDSRDLHFESLNVALSEVNENFVISQKLHLNRFDGLSTARKMEILVDDYGFPADKVKQVRDRKQEITMQLLTKVKPDVEKKRIFEMLRASGYTIAVCSNAVRMTVLTSLKALDLLQYVTHFYGNEDVKRQKPATEIYLRALITCGVDPQEALIIEDSLVGREGAHNSGCHVMAVEDSDSWSSEDLFGQLDQINSKDKPRMKWSAKKMNVLIPMAGAGSRFEKAGYTFPKPLIDVRGKPMIQVVIENLNIDANFIFIAQNEHIKKYNLQTFLNRIAPDCKLIGIDGVTEGAACTTLLAKKYIDNENPLIIANSDQFVEWNANDFYYAMSANKNTDAGIVTFKAMHPKWSFAKIEEGLVTQVAEKNPISDDATVGIYYWKRGQDYVEAAEEMIASNERINGEFYVCPVFNVGIAYGKKVKPYQISKMWGIGTPEDLNYFLENYKGEV